MEATVLSCHFSWVWPSILKFFWNSNHQYLWKGLTDFVDFLKLVICILLYINWSCKYMLFWADTVRHSLSTNQNVRYFKLKHSLLPQLAGFFTFDLFDLLVLTPEDPSYIVLVKLGVLVCHFFPLSVHHQAWKFGKFREMIHRYRVMPCGNDEINFCFPK